MRVDVKGNRLENFRVGSRVASGVNIMSGPLPEMRGVAYGSGMILRLEKEEIGRMGRCST